MEEERKAEDRSRAVYTLEDLKERPNRIKMLGAAAPWKVEDKEAPFREVVAWKMEYSKKVPKGSIGQEEVKKAAGSSCLSCVIRRKKSTDASKEYADQSAGTRKEFMNRFVNPIVNGQHSDSTERDIRMMKKRSFILNDFLKVKALKSD